VWQAAQKISFWNLAENCRILPSDHASISSVSHDLVELVAGSESSQLTTRLRRLFDEMNEYLERVNTTGQSKLQYPGTDHGST
jgi:hypothetical protein